MAQELVNVNDIAKQAAAEALRLVREAATPKAETKALTESTTTTPKVSYKELLAQAMKDTTDGQRNYYKIMEETVIKGPELKEGIGLVAGTAAIPTIWAKDVFRCCPYPASAFWDAPFVKWHEDIHNQPGSLLTITTVGRAVAVAGTCGEPATTASSIENVNLELEEYHCAYSVCKTDLEDMIPDTVTELNNSLSECITIAIDNAFIANITGTGSTYSFGTAIMTAARIAQVMGSMRSGTCEPVAIIIHPVVEATLMQEAQFVNAATFGDRSVITGGHIIKYLGLDIIVVPKGSLHPGVGTYSSLMLARYAVHAAKKRDPTIESQYELRQQKRFVLASVRFGKKVVCNYGVWWMFTAA